MCENPNTGFMILISEQNSISLTNFDKPHAIRVEIGTRLHTKQANVAFVKQGAELSISPFRNVPGAHLDINLLK